MELLVIVTIAFFIGTIVYISINAGHIEAEQIFPRFIVLMGAHKTYQRDQGDRMSTIALTIVICIAIASLAYSVYEIISYKTDKQYIPCLYRLDGNAYNTLSLFGIGRLCLRKWSGLKPPFPEVLAHSLDKNEYFVYCLESVDRFTL